MGDSQSVADLRDSVQDLGEHTFKHLEDLSGAEPRFLRVRTRGEYQALLRWDNAPPLELQPRSRRRGREPISVASIEQPKFTTDTTRQNLADFYNVSVGVYLISETLLEAITLKGDESIESRPAILSSTLGGCIDGFRLVLPTRVLDAVDTAKTDVTILRKELTPGSGIFLNHVRFNAGYSLKPSVVRDLAQFVEEHSGNWLWSEALFLAAGEGGRRGIYGAPTHSNHASSEIRI